MRKKVLLLAVSCRQGGLCPGGLDLDNPKEWIRIVKDDGRSGAVQGFEIDFAKPLDIIEFDGRSMPQGKQQENWVIDNRSCKNLGAATNIWNWTESKVLEWAYNNYGYHGYWNNYRSFLNEQEFENVNAPSESILKVSNLRIYRNSYNHAKLDFDWSYAQYRLQGVSMTDQDFYDKIVNGEVTFQEAYIVISIPKQIDDFVNPNTGQKQAYKFVSRIFNIL
ncbi:MAG: hypothetical protein J6Y72_07375 [Bacteroidales bacterium]|nr:hypothetical protein [Bacteroidales bacterium]